MALVGLQTRLFPHFLLHPPVPFGKHPPLTSSTSDVASSGNATLALLWKCPFSPDPLLSVQQPELEIWKPSGGLGGVGRQGAWPESVRGQATHPPSS